MNNERVSIALGWWHPIAVLVAVALDWLWTIIDIAALMVNPLFLVLTCLGFFLITTGIVYYIQRHVAEENGNKSLAKGIAMGICVAIPTPFFGSAVGLGSLILSGGGALVKRYWK